MEKIYTKHQKRCELIQAQPETVQLLLNFSKALHIVEHGNMKFEGNLN